MYLDTDMVGHQAHDALGVVGREAGAGVFQSTRQPVDPEAAIRVEHDLDDGRVFEVAGDGWPKRSAQHACAASKHFGPEGDRRHDEPRKLASRGGPDVSGVD